MVVLGSACDAASCTSRSGTPASRAAVMKECRSECGVTALSIPAPLVSRRTIRVAAWRFSRRVPSKLQKIGPYSRSPTHCVTNLSMGSVMWEALTRERCALPHRHHRATHPPRSPGLTPCFIFLSSRNSAATAQNQPPNQSRQPNRRPNPREVTRPARSGDGIAQFDLDDLVATPGLRPEFGDFLVGCGGQV